MTDFENDLRGAVRRREPPRDLTAGILARAGTCAAPARVSWRVVWAAAAVVLAMVAGVGEGLRAKRQLMFAMELTSQKLGSAGAKVAEVSQRRIGRD